MDLMEEMWISRPQRRMTKLSDLSDGSIARIKFYNANKESQLYTLMYQTKYLILYYQLQGKIKPTYLRNRSVLK